MSQPPSELDRATVVEIVEYMRAVAQRILGLREHRNLSNQQISGMIGAAVTADPVVKKIVKEALLPFTEEYLGVPSTHSEASEEAEADTARWPTEIEMRRHLAAATSPLPHQAPAIEALVVLRGMANAISGSLSETPEGGLRMLSKIGEDPRGGRTHYMVEQFFCYEDVLVFGVQHTVTIEPPLFSHS